MAYVISRAFDYAVVGRGRGVRSRSRSPSHAAVREESPSEFEETALQRRLCAVQARKAESAEPISGPAVGPRRRASTFEADWSPPMPRAGMGAKAQVSEAVGPRLCQAVGQRIMRYGTDCVSWLRIRKEGLRGTHIELCADEPCTPDVDVVIELNLQLMLLDGIEVFQSANGVALSGWVPTMYIERAVFVKMRGRQNRHNLFKDQTDLTNHQIRNRTAIGFAFLEALSAHVPDACSRSLDGRRSCSRGSRGCGYDHCDRCGSSSDCGSEAPTVCPGSARLRPAPRHATEPALAPKPSAAPSARCGSRFFCFAANAA